MRRGGVRTVTLYADVERYGSIAEGWPPVIILQDATLEQITYFLENGTFECGCDDLFTDERPFH